MYAGFLPRLVVTPGFIKSATRSGVSGGAPAYQNTFNPQLWLARDAEGNWRGQLQCKMGEMSSLLKLVDRNCTYPTSASDAAWQYIDPATKDWEKAWTL